MLDEDHNETTSKIEVYVRVSCLGRCITTETYAPRSIRKAFYAREESDDYYEYQFRELSTEDVEAFHWGSATILPPLHPDHLICNCRIEEKEEGTQTLKQKKKVKRDEYAARLAQVQKLLALMKEMRKNRPEIPGLGDGPKNVCGAVTDVCSPCAPAPCFVNLSSACPTSCEPTTVCCVPPPC